MLGCEEPMRPPIFFSLALTLLTVSVGASPKPSKHMTARVAMNAAALKFGRSVGSPTDGHLLGGMRLEDAPYVRVMPHDVPGDVRWGLSPLVSMIDRAAKRVAKTYPGSVLELGHLSRPGGGDVGDHASHESGRDADLAYYVKNAKGKQIFTDRMVPFLGDGTAPTWPGARFDDARNWLLISSIVEDRANVSHIFVAAPIRARLLSYAAKIGAPAEVRTRAAELMMQPHGCLPHDDHFHVRISCPAGQHECVENPAPRRKARPARVPTPKKRERAEAAPLPPTRHEAPERAEPERRAPSSAVAPEPTTTTADASDSSLDDVTTSPAIIGAPNEQAEGD